MKRIRLTLGIIIYSVILLMGCASTQTPELKQEIADLKQQMVAMADDLKKIRGNEGYNFDTLYTVFQGHSTNLKYLRNKLTELTAMYGTTDKNLKRVLERTNGQTQILVWYEWGSVKMHVRAVNLSVSETIKTPITVYLPKEIKPGDIIDKDKFTISYDVDKDIYYAQLTKYLKPREYAEFTITLKDVWNTPKQFTTSVLNEAKEYLAQLKSTPHQEKAQLLFNNIDVILAEALKAQRRGNTQTPLEHIYIYRENLESLKKADSYLEKLKELRQDFILEKLEKSIEELKKRLK